MSDLRLAVRTLWQSRGFAAVAVLTFALGIGANTAIFSVIYAVLLQATPYKNADRILRLYEKGPIGSTMNVNPLNFQDWRRANASFERLALFRPDAMTVGNIDPPIRAAGANVSASLFPMLSAAAEFGRVFSDAEDKPGAIPVVVLAHGFWQEHFGGNPKIVGQSLKIDGRPSTIIGVMPASFDFPEPTQFWVPAGLSYNDRLWQIRTAHFANALGQLKPGVTVARAGAELDAIAKDLEQKYPKSNDRIGVTMVSFHEDTVGNVRPALLSLLAGVGFVLLIACANVANLLLARALQRKRDVAIQVALGASRGRIVRQLLVESVALAVAGGACGILLAVWTVDSVAKLVQETLPHAGHIQINLPVLVFTFFAALVTGVLSGLAPSWQSSKADLNAALKETGRASTGGIERHRTRSALVVCEIALSFVLLIGAGLMVRTFARLASVDLGFKPDHVLTMQISLPDRKYPVDRLLRGIRNVPGVLDASVAAPMPVTTGGWQDIFVQPGEPRRTFTTVSWTHMTSTSPHYFETMRIPLIAGRFFDERDGEKDRCAVIVDELFVKRYWPHEPPLGKRIKFDFDPQSTEPWCPVVGVVGHVRNNGAEQHWAKDPLVEAYVPYLQVPLEEYTVAVRTVGDPAHMSGAVQNAIRAVDRGVPISMVRTMDEWVSLSLQNRRFSMLLLSIFAGIGLVLALVGVYGVMAYSVTQRLHEIGIRVALGAERRDVVRLVLGNAIRLAGIGLATGCILSLALSRWLQQVVFGVSATDPGTFVSVSVLLAAAALAASYIPAHRATKVDPMVALRYE